MPLSTLRRLLLKLRPQWRPEVPQAMIELQKDRPLHYIALRERQVRSKGVLRSTWRRTKR